MLSTLSTPTSHGRGWDSRDPNQRGAVAHGCPSHRGAKGNLLRAMSQVIDLPSLVLECSDQ